MAGAAFKDADTVKIIENFTPILVDGDVEKEAVQKFGVRGYPTTIFVNAKGEQLANMVGFPGLGGFKSKAKSAAKSAGKPRPSKDYKPLMKADAELTKALEKKQTSKALAAIGKIEKIGRACAITDRALAAKKTIVAAGKAAIETAVANEDAGKALKALKKVLRDFRGADDVESAARAEIKKLEAAAEEAGE